MQRTSISVISVLLLGGLAGCAPADLDAARMGVLHAFLVEDNRVWLNRDPDLLAQKYRSMDADPFHFMRGTSGLFLADLARVSGPRADTTLLRVPEASQVLLVGDPHPENLGTTLPGEGPGPSSGEEAPTLPLEWMDLDGATFGPYLVDVRRAALGLSALLEPLDGCEVACWEAVIDHLAWGYVEGLELDANPSADPSWELGGMEWDLIREAHSEGSKRKKLDKYTLDGELIKQEFEDLPNGKVIVPATEDEAAQIARLMDAYPGPEGLRILDIARRYGQGISSLPAKRYIVLWDRGEEGPEDNDMLTIREVLDPPTVPTTSGMTWGPFDDNAHRTEVTAQRLWSTPDADVRYAGLRDGEQSFKAMTWSSWFQEFDHEKIAKSWDKQDADSDDLAALAHCVGLHLGAAHARSGTLYGSSSREAVLSDLAGHERRFVDELKVMAKADRERWQRDVILFRVLLDEAGPTLTPAVAREKEL